MVAQLMMQIGFVAAAAGFSAAAVFFFRLRIPAAVRHLLYARRQSSGRRRGRRRFFFLFLLWCLLPAFAAKVRGEAVYPESTKQEGERPDPFESGPWPEDESGIWPDEDDLIRPDPAAMEEYADGEGAGRGGAAEEAENAGETYGGDILVEMEGGYRDKDGMWYYRADNCGITVTFPKTTGKEGVPGDGTWHILLDGRDITGEARSRTGADEERICTFSAALISGLLSSDGEHCLAVFTSEGDVKTKGLTTASSGGSFILDRTPPVCRMQLTAPGARFRSIKKRGNRYYLNSRFRITFTFTDDHPDPELLEVSRGCEREGTYSSADVRIRSFPEPLKILSGTAQDSPDQDGVYRYTVRGCDKAGNAVTFSGDGQLDARGRTPHIVLDRTGPEGRLYITAGGAVCCSVRTDGKETCFRKAAAASKATVLIHTDIKKEHSPVRIRCLLSPSPSSACRKQVSGKWAYGASLRVPVRRKCALRVSGLLLEDYAGNRTFRGISGAVNLDPDPPSVEIRAGQAPAGRTREGYPLYSGDISLKITAHDSAAGKGGSGLDRVSCSLRRSAGETNESEKTLYASGHGKALYTYIGSLAAAASEYEGNTALVSVTAVDRAGNRATSVFHFAIDRTGPQITTAYEEPAPGGYIGHARRGRITVKDRHFTEEGAVLRAGDETPSLHWRRTGISDSGEECWETDVVFEKDGEYRPELSVSDAAGNQSACNAFGGEEDAFVIDTLPPQIVLKDTGGTAANGTYYREARRLLIEVEDASFKGEHTLEWDLDGGASHGVVFEDGLAEIEFCENGTYRLRGGVTDAAGNRADLPEIQPFTVDTVPPEISVEGPASGSANAQPVQLGVTVTDPHMEKSGFMAVLTKDGGKDQILPCLPQQTEGGWYYEFGPFSEDGLYRIRMKAGDLAGNECEEESVFTVNTKGTVFEFEQAQLCRAWLREPIRPSFLLHDIDEVTILSFTINGEEKPYIYEGTVVKPKETLSQDGIYRIGMETTDAAGHVSIMEEAVIRIDSTPPVLTVLGTGKGHEIKPGPVTLRLLSDDPDAVLSELLLDGENVEDCTPDAEGAVVIRVEERGEHTLSARLTDQAGNVSERCVRTFLITGNPLLLVYGNRPLFFVLVLFLIAGIVFSCRFLYAKKST